MPSGQYSFAGEIDQQRFAVTEPGSQSRGTQGHSSSQDWEGIQAKEPDRQSTTRRGASRGRSGMDAGYEEENETRGRSTSQRGGGNRGSGAQARRAAEQRGQTARRSSGASSARGGAKKSRRGFAAMSPEQQREIARKGGLTVS